MGYACYTRYEPHSYPSVNFVLGVISVVLAIRVIRVGRFGPIYSLTPLTLLFLVLSVLWVLFPHPPFKTVPPHHLQRFDSQTRFFIYPQ